MGYNNLGIKGQEKVVFLSPSAMSGNCRTWVFTPPIEQVKEYEDERAVITALSSCIRVDIRAFQVVIALICRK
jgi:hypothetical protein